MLGDMAVQDIDRRTVSRFYAALAKAPARSRRSATGSPKGMTRRRSSAVFLLQKQAAVPKQSPKPTIIISKA